MIQKDMCDTCIHRKYCFGAYKKRSKDEYKTTFQKVRDIMLESPQIYRWKMEELPVGVSGRRHNMTDTEISEYLQQHNYEVYGQDFIMDVSNNSYQIRDMDLDYKTMIMTIYTDNENKFRFKWLLHNLSEENKDEND